MHCIFELRFPERERVQIANRQKSTIINHVIVIDYPIYHRSYS